MEHVPSPEMTEQEIRTRLAEIDRQIIEREDSITGVTGKYEESSSSDDNASENELAQQDLDKIKKEIEDLRTEASTLREQLEKFQQAA